MKELGCQTLPDRSAIQATGSKVEGGRHVRRRLSDLRRQVCGKPDPSKHGILVEANIHGGELAGNMASLEMIQHTCPATSGNKDVLDTLDKCTIWFLPERLIRRGHVH